MTLPKLVIAAVVPVAYVSMTLPVTTRLTLPPALMLSIERLPGLSIDTSPADTMTTGTGLPESPPSTLTSSNSWTVIESSRETRSPVASATVPSIVVWLASRSSVTFCHVPVAVKFGGRQVDRAGGAEVAVQRVAARQHARHRRPRQQLLVREAQRREAAGHRDRLDAGQAADLAARAADGQRHARADDVRPLAARRRGADADREDELRVQVGGQRDRQRVLDRARREDDRRAAEGRRQRRLVGERLGLALRAQRLEVRVEDRARDRPDLDDAARRDRGEPGRVLRRGEHHREAGRRGGRGIGRPHLRRQQQQVAGRLDDVDAALGAGGEAAGARREDAAVDRQRRRARAERAGGRRQLDAVALDQRPARARGRSADARGDAAGGAEEHVAAGRDDRARRAAGSSARRWRRR